MDVVNAVYPTSEQLESLLDGAPAGPIVMVNLLTFRPEAE